MKNENKHFNFGVRMGPIQELLEEVSFLLQMGSVMFVPDQVQEVKLEKLRNPEIFTKNSRGGFASAATISSSYSRVD